MSLVITPACSGRSRWQSSQQGHSSCVAHVATNIMNMHDAISQTADQYGCAGSAGRGGAPACNDQQAHAASMAPTLPRSCCACCHLGTCLGGFAGSMHCRLVQLPHCAEAGRCLHSAVQMRAWRTAPPLPPVRLAARRRMSVNSPIDPTPQVARESQVVFWRKMKFALGQQSSVTCASVGDMHQECTDAHGRAACVVYLWGGVGRPQARCGGVKQRKLMK